MLRFPVTTWFPKVSEQIEESDQLRKSNKQSQRAESIKSTTE